MSVDPLPVPVDCDREVLEGYPRKVSERVVPDIHRGKRRGNLGDRLPESPGEGVAVPGRAGGGVGGPTGGYDKHVGPQDRHLRPDEEPVRVPLDAQHGLTALDIHPPAGALSKEDGEDVG